MCYMYVLCVFWFFLEGFFGGGGLGYVIFPLSTLYDQSSYVVLSLRTFWVVDCRLCVFVSR